MNPGAIYSKSGKGVQEASGKTSLLKRGERAVLSAIDGRTTLAGVAEKVGKPLDAAFEALIAQLDKDGFVREVVAAPSPAASTPRGPVIKPPPPKPAGNVSAPGEDLDFTGVMGALRSGTKPPEKTPDPRAKEQEAALHKARQEAEARAQAQRERARMEAEQKAREEAAARLKAEVEAKAKAEAEAKAKAARDAAVRMAAEAKAKAEAQAQAKIEAERKAREEAERKAREEADKAREEAERVRREAEALRLKLEEERRAREEAERKAREEAERRAREEEERKARAAAEAKRRQEEEERRAREEAERKAREDEERKAREAAEAKRRQEEEERKAREEEERKAREAAEAKRRQEDEERRAREEAERRAKEEEEQARKAQEATQIRQETLAAAQTGKPSLDALMANLDTFSDGDAEDERAAREAAEKKALEAKRQEEEARRAREEQERRAREEQERRAREEQERLAREEDERRRGEALAREREKQEREARERQEREERERQEREEHERKEREKREKREAEEREKREKREAKEREKREKREARRRETEGREQAAAAPAGAVAYRPLKRRTPFKWGRSIAMTLFVLLVAGIVGLHVIPLPVEQYEQTASAALGAPVRIQSGRLSLIGGPHLELSGVRIGDAVRIPRAKAYPELGAWFDERKAFKRIEVEGAAVPQQVLGPALFGRARGDQFTVARVVLKDVKLEGTLPLPPLEAEALLGPDGAVRSVRLRGPDGLAGTLTPAGQAVEFDVTAERFTVPFAPEVALSSFAMKGKATSQSLEVASWGGAVLDGALSGVANVRWTSRWEVNGALTVRGINAAVFAPALLSEGKAEGSGKFVMAGADPAALAAGARLEGSFTVHKGVLGNIDLSRVIQTGGRQHAGRTQFVELKAQGLYDRGAIALRDIAISAGALNAGASADIAQNGALSGRIVADVKTASQTLRQTLQLGGTVKEPQVRN